MSKAIRINGIEQAYEQAQVCIAMLNNAAVEAVEAQASEPSPEFLDKLVRLEAIIRSQDAEIAALANRNNDLTGKLNAIRAAMVEIVPQGMGTDAKPDGYSDTLTARVHCSECGVAFIPRVRNQKTCSPACRVDRNRRLNREKYTPKGRQKICLDGLVFGGVRTTSPSGRGYYSTPSDTPCFGKPDSNPCELQGCDKPAMEDCGACDMCRYGGL